MSIEERPITAELEVATPEAEGPPVETIDGFSFVDEKADPKLTPAPKALPVEGNERVASVDVIRGLALMGILAMNIVNFGWPQAVYGTPIIPPNFDYDWGNVGLWGFNHLFFDTKMMTLFSMLFGAGLVLMSDRAKGRGAKMGGVYYRRVFWLLVIGLIHAYLIWDGDILVWYASCGLLLYPVRKWSPKTLIIVGVCMNLIFVPLLLGFRFGGIPYMKRTAERVEAQTKAGEKPSEWDKNVSERYKEMTKQEKPRWEDFVTEIAVHRGGYWGIVKDRASTLIWAQTLGFVFGGVWLAGGRMLIGMGLMKLGVFGAQLSKRAYQIMMVVGYGIGLPLMLFDVVHESMNGFFLGRTLWYVLDGWPFLTLYGSLFVVFGHIGLVMLICQTNALPWLTRRLGAAGRMALSCYLFDSIFCSTLFYGYGLDFFGSLHRPLLYAIVITIWTAQLLICPLWLEKFRFGPAEWLWRSLTYWKLQPMKPKAA
jgi:uncharacterized protein